MRATAAAAPGGRATRGRRPGRRIVTTSQHANLACKDAKIRTPARHALPCDPTGVLAHTGRPTLSLAACLQNVARGVVERKRCSHFLQSVSADRS